MHNPESVRENETHNILWNFVIQTNRLIPTRRTDLAIVNEKKRTWQIADLGIPADHIVTLKESEKRNKYLDLARELKETMEHESSGDTNCKWCTWYSHQRIGTVTEGLGNKRTSGDHPKYGIVEISQNTKKSPGNLRRLLSLTPQWKTIS